MLPSFSASVAGSVGAYVVFRLCKAVYEELVSPHRLLPGPKSTHWLFGNIVEAFKDNLTEYIECLIAQYGETFHFHGLLGQTHLMTVDAKAVQHFLTCSDIYQKPEPFRLNLGRGIGPGLLVVEDDEHKKQRKIMNPAFGPSQIRQLTEIFLDVSLQLRDIWAAQVTAGGGVARIDVLPWFNKASLDMIGLAGFNRRINALGTESHETADELAGAFETLMHLEDNVRLGLVEFLQQRFPILDRIHTKHEKVQIEAQATMKRIGAHILSENKRQVGTFEESSSTGRDLLSLLVRANTAKEISPKQKLTDEDVLTRNLAEVPTFLVAGHETTSSALTFALYALGVNPEVQSRLREELLELSMDNPTLDELNSLEYLESLVRETLRLYAPVAFTNRVAMQDDIVPLAKTVTDIYGVKRDSLRIRKGDPIVIPIAPMNRSTQVWGPDALEFNPDRWLSPPSSAQAATPGIYANLLTFIAGPHACIGYRFTLAEMKASVFTLVRAFEFQLAVPKEDIAVVTAGVVQRPIVLSEKAKGTQMPLLVRPVLR
ncbi:cytochrome P450 [Roridomyces roridus]|uniref:Cytochrome P450 n=1 Tax=Roridomyces roridus TaxID=1738132 RepID=A0AAD7C965_9AGAR|nr:cytochrome P450 [Roridomyces roridus]